MTDFTGLHVVVTGGNGALGSAVVDALLEQGAHCHIPSRRPVDNPHPRDRVRVVGGVDLTNEASVEAFYGDLPELWASIHVAGGFQMAPLTETRLEDFTRLFAMNACTAFLSCREATKVIRRSQNGGRLVNIIAKPVLVPTGGLVAYAASKAAVAALTHTLSEELAADRIWVNAVAPSIMDTPANRAGMPNADHDRWPSVADVAQTIVFLASPSNAVSRGALVPVYGQS